MADIETIKQQISRRKNRIVLIPDDTVIEPTLLGSLTNGEFVSTFRAYQKLLIEMYSEIEQDPEKYGFSLTPSQTFSYTFYYRLCDFLFFTCYCGIFQDGKVKVSTADFKHMMRKHKKLNILVDLLTSYGFVFEDYTTKSESFMVSYLNNRDLMYVIYRDVEVRKKSKEWDGYFHDVIWYASYRWVEATDLQKHEKRFLSHMDISSEKFRELQYWLYDKAKEYGYHIPKDRVGGPHNSVLYQKGKKDFLYVCEREDNGENRLFVKLIIRNTFTSHPEKILALSERFANVFEDMWAACNLCVNRGGNWPADHVCSCQIHYEFNGERHKNCAHKSFYFHNPELKDIRLLSELFVLENNIKPVH
jgi:hypothetical protein